MRHEGSRARLRLVLTPTTWLSRSVLAVGGCLALAATSTGASASDLGVGVAPVVNPVSTVADVQALTSRRDVSGGSKYAGVPAPAPVPAPVPEEGPLGIPGIPYAAYRGAADRMAGEQPGCGVSWTLLAGIGYVESSHVHNGRTDAAGTVLEKVLGPVLDGSGPGDGVVRDTDRGGLDGDPVYDRAVGPTQFLPATWALYGADGNGDGVADPQNVFDSALYLCSNGMNLRDSGQVQTAVYRYNHSYDYVAKVTMWAQAYLTGSSPSSGITSSSSSSSSGYTSGSSSSYSYGG